MSSTLPLRPSLSSLHKQAKALLREHRHGGADARERVRENHPRPDSFTSLRDAQLVVARGYGFKDWAELTRGVEKALSEAMKRAGQADLFVDLACLTYSDDDDAARHRRAARMLEQDPDLAGESIFAAVVAGDVDAVVRLLGEEPTRASERGGPRDWEPLLYLAYARVPDAPPGSDAIEVAHMLLDAGADPNAHVILNNAYRFTALTGAIGEGEAGLVAQPPHARARALAELLLATGADPNDSQGMYNSHFNPGNEWIELLIAKGLTAADPCNWAGMDGLGTLDYLLGQAVVTGLESRVRLLLDHGTDANGRDAYHDRTHLKNAILNGHQEIAALLEARGAPPAKLSASDRFRAACMAGDSDAALRQLAETPGLIEQPSLFIDCARHGSISGLGHLLDAGVDVNQRSSDGRTALHQAAWAGRDELIHFVLERGAEPDVRDGVYDSTPASWANQSGHYTTRDYLLARSRDAFDLATWGCVDALADILRSDPSLAAHALAKSGNTPLHRLETSGERGARVIEMLIANRADINAENRRGRTPLYNAIVGHQDEVAELLRERGAICRPKLRQGA